MAMKLYNDVDIQDIADAIREVNGESTTYKVSEMAAAIRALKEAENLFDPTDADIVLRGRFNSSGAAVAYSDGQLVTGYISASVGDIFVVETDKSAATNNYTGMLECLNENKVYITSTIPYGASAVWTYDSTYTTGVCSIPSVWSGHDYSATAFVRFCVAYTNIANIKITKTTVAPTLN